jgi:hypothetical protein
MILVVDAITISYRPWSAIRPGKARPHPRLLELSQTASRLVSILEFRRKSNSYLTLPSQGEAIEAYVLKPFTPKASEKRSRLPHNANSKISGTMTR